MLLRFYGKWGKVRFLFTGCEINFEQTHYILKNLFYSCLLLIIIQGCTSVSSADRDATTQTDDSLDYYPPTPGRLSKQEYRQYLRQLTVFFDSTLLKSGFNGGILIAKNGSVIYEKYNGRTDLRKKDSLDAGTPLHIASVSKTFTAIAALRLVQEKKLSLSDTLNTFFPGFPYPGITVKMLLNHRSGLPNYLYFMSNYKWGILPNKKWNRQLAKNDDVVKMMYERRPDKVANPDKRFNYCNTNYLLLALIIEKITGREFPDYMQEKFFGPLGMKNTYVFRLKDTLSAAPSFTGRNVYWEYDFLDATYGDKNIYSTPQDLLKWDQALYTYQVLDSALLEAAFTPYSFEKSGTQNYGLGWRLQLLPNGKKIIYHFGKWHGFNAVFGRLTDEKATVIILGNKFNRNIYRYGRMSYDIFGDYMQNNTGDEEDSEVPDTGKEKAAVTEKKTKSKT